MTVANSGALAGIVLAAGASTRLGRPKQLLALSGRPLLQHVLDAAAASCLDEVILVLGHRAAEIQAALALPVGARVVVNPAHAVGQSGSLRLGLRSVGPRVAGAAILLGDQPGVSARLIDRAVAAFRASETPVARPVYVAGERRVPGHPVILARRVWPEVEPLQGDEGARTLLAQHPEWVLELLVDGEPPADIDTVDDYERAVDAARSLTIRPEET